MKHTFFLFNLLLALVSGALAQNPDFTGVWRGKFYDNSSFGFSSDPYKFEVQIDQTNKGLVGVTYSYLNTVFYGKASHNGFVKTDGKKLVLQETALLELKSSNGQACLMTCTMRYSKVGMDEFLEGTYTAIDKDNGSPCPGGYVKLKRVPTSDFYIEKNIKKKLDAKTKVVTPPKPKPPVVKTPLKPKPKPPVVKTLPKPKPPVVKTTPKPKPPVVITPKPPVVKPPVVKTPVPKPPDTSSRIVKTPPVVVQPPIVKTPPPVKIDTPVVKLPPVKPLAERTNELVQTINVADTNQFEVHLYDYGEVDGDVVTVYVDGREVISKQMLRTSPIVIPLQVNGNAPEHTLTMVAENLGTIPPNTALMIVTVNGKRYEAKIESTEQKNAMVKFVYQTGGKKK
jgi:hypothetical protein